MDHLRLLTVQPPYLVQYGGYWYAIGTVTVPLVVTIIRMVILIYTILIVVYHAIIFYWYIWYSFGARISNICRVL